MKHAGQNLRGAMTWFLLVAVVVLGGPVGATAAVHVALSPPSTLVAPGQVFTIEITITEAGSPFNAYAARVEYNPQYLTFIPRPQSEQEGPLMTEACPARFHVFDAEGDLLSVDHVLLCAGVTVTGPGVLYRLQFQAGPDFAVTTLSLVDGTAFYEAGNPVFPVLTQNAQVRIGDLTDVPAPGAASALDLRASPNPFNPRTVFTFDLELAGPSRLAVYTLDGRLVRTLALGHLARGRHEYAWDGTTDAGRPAEAGVYCARLEVLGQRAFRTITLVK